MGYQKGFYEGCPTGSVLLTIRVSIRSIINKAS